MIELKNLKKHPKKIQTTLDKTQAKIDIEEWTFDPTEQGNYSFIGIDPGTTNVGLAIYDHNFSKFFLWEIRMKREKTMERRMEVFVEILNYALPAGAKIAVIEAPGYMSSPYRQAELEDVRCAVVLWKHARLVEQIWVVPPNAVRKQVFGNGKMKNPWKDLGVSGNAAAALGCALYPIMLEQEK